MIPLATMKAIMCLGLAASGPSQDVRSPDPSQYVDIYAPVVQFNGTTVRVLPTPFPGEPPSRDICTYVNIKAMPDGTLFQYWLYYPRDIRMTPELDAVATSTAARLSGCMAKHPGAALGAGEVSTFCDVFMKQVNMLFHEHDWELIEVLVPRLGEVPSVVGYCFHKVTHKLPTHSLLPGAAPMQGMHPLVKVISDMHGCYPAGGWGPLDARMSGGAVALNLGIGVEFSVAYVQEVMAGQVVPGTASYTSVALAGKCRPFSEAMKRIQHLDGYPYAMPWDRNFEY